MGAKLLPYFKIGFFQVYLFVIPTAHAITFGANTFSPEFY